MIRITFADRATGEPLATNQITATNPGGLFGGSAQNITSAFAKALANSAKLLLEKPASATSEPAAIDSLAAPPAAADRKIVIITGGNFEQGEADLNAEASAGYRLVAFTPKGVESAQVTMERSATPQQIYRYRVLHVYLFGNLEKDLNKAAAEGYRYRPYTLAWLAGGGMMGAGFAIMEKAPLPSDMSYEYRVHAPAQVSNAQKDVAKDIREDFDLLGTLEVPGKHVALLERMVSKAGE